MSGKMRGHNQLEEKVGELEKSISGYRELERELRSAKELTDRLIETANAIVLLLDSNADITLFNAAAEKLTGYSKEEAIGLNWIETFVPEVARNSVGKVFKEVIQREGDIFSYENPIVTKSGEERIVSWRNNIIRDGNSGAIGVLSIGVDITEQRRAELELKANEAKYRKVFETANDAIFVFRGEEIIDCNSRTIEMFGYETREQVIGLHPWEFSPEYQPDGQTSKVAAEFRINEALCGRSQLFSWIHQRTSGEAFDAEVSLSSFQMAGENYLLAVVRDVTELKRAANMLRSVVKGTSSTTGQEFFKSLVRHLAGGLGVTSALVAELDSSEEAAIHALAFWDRGQFHEECLLRFGRNAL